MATKYSRRTLGFGVPATEDPHHYLINIPRNGPAIITEILTGSTEIITRVFLERARWEAVSVPVQRAFNKRLKELSLAPERWKRGDNLVDRLLGKEVCVLAWAIEEIEFSLIGLAARNWLALDVTERWWLFGMAARDAGRAGDEIVGWRKALGVALTGGGS